MEHTFDITIVVPTYNRKTLLQAAVNSLRQQTFPADRYEILIVSDGATDGTDELYQTPLESPRTRLIRQEVEGFGLSAARNLGIRAGEGQLVMFFDDDMVAHEGLVEAHVAAHARFDDNVAVRGRVKPAPELPDTPFCHIVLGDVCRIYEENPEEARFIDFGTALSWQTSYKRATIARLGGYDETFNCYGWEDIEFAYRVTRDGLRFYYEPQAISFHNDQRQTLPAHGQRLQNASKMAPLMFARHPELVEQIPMYLDKGPIDWRNDSVPLLLKKMSREMFNMRPVVGMLEAMTPLLEKVAHPGLLRRWYYGILGYYVTRGYREGLLTMNRQQGN